MTNEQKLANLTKIPVTIGQVDISGHRINYAVAGQGKPLLLIHGANLGWGQWYANIAALAESFTVYAIDLPGAGRSSGIEYHQSDLNQVFVETTASFMEQFNLSNIPVIGHSVGAWTVLKLAMKHPNLIQKLILISPVGFTESTPIFQKLVGLRPVVNVLSKTVMKPSKKNMRRFLESGFCDRTKLSEELLDYYHERVAGDQRSHPLYLVNHMAGFSKVKPDFVLLEEVKRLTQPVLIVVGQHDPLVPPHKKHLAGFKNIPDVKVEIFNDSAHVPFIEESQRFNSVVLNFLKD